MDKPVLLSAGHGNHQGMWRPLSDSYRLAFLEDGVAALAEQMDIPDVMRLERFVPNFAADKGRAMVFTSEITESIMAGRLVFDDAVPALTGLGLAAWFPTMLYESLAASLGRISACATLHQKEGIAGVLVHEDVTNVGRTLSAWGNSVGVPTLHIPHANHFSRPGTGDVHCKTTAKHLGVCGEYMAGWYAACGVPANRITRIGAPQWDHFYDEEKMPSRELARHGFGIKDDEFVLCYSGTWYQLTGGWGEDPETYLDGCLERVVSVARGTGAFLIVSMHPGEQAGQENHYVEAMTKAGIRGAVTRSHPEYASRAADVAITQGPSNAGIRHAMLGAPVVELYLQGARYPDWGPPGTWGRELPELIESVRAAGPDREFVRRMNFSDDGKATGRAVEWVRSLCPV